MKDWAIFPYECGCHDCNYHRVIEKISDKKEKLALAKYETYLSELTDKSKPDQES